MLLSGDFITCWHLCVRLDWARKGGDTHPHRGYHLSATAGNAVMAAETSAAPSGTCAGSAQLGTATKLTGLSWCFQVSPIRKRIKQGRNAYMNRTWLGTMKVTETHRKWHWKDRLDSMSKTLRKLKTVDVFCRPDFLKWFTNPLLKETIISDPQC